MPSRESPAAPSSEHEKALVQIAHVLGGAANPEPSKWKCGNNCEGSEGAAMETPERPAACGVPLGTSEYLSVFCKLPAGHDGPHSTRPERPAAFVPRHGRFAGNDLRYRNGDHPAQTQFTPSYVLDPVRVDLGGSIGLDPCTTPDNPVGATYFYTAEDDGLDLINNSWWYAPTEEIAFIDSVFVNPPYSKAREPWVERCITAGDRGQKVVLLIPAATDTRIFQKAVSTSTAVVFVKGRVKFGTLRPNRRQHAASHPSALIGWNTDLWACGALGWRSTTLRGAA